MLKQKPHWSNLLLNIFWGFVVMFLLFLTGFWYLLFGPVLTITAFFRAVQNPIREVDQLHMVRSYYNRFNDNHNYWFTFRSSRAINLKDVKDFSRVTVEWSRERTTFGLLELGAKNTWGMT